jgi:hypothetical protein
MQETRRFKPSTVSRRISVLAGRVGLDEGTLRRTTVGASTRKCRPVGEAQMVGGVA